MNRPRLRDLGIVIGSLPPGAHNAITDVPDVWVGHTTLVHDQPRLARTGVTVIVPRAGAIHQDHAFAGVHAFNGCGEMTGVHWIAESGLLTSPVALTDTTQLGVVRDALIQYPLNRRGRGAHYLGVVAETWGGWLNDRNAFHLEPEHVFQALDGAGPGAVAEGSVGGGTPMICYDFKGGIGTASRRVETPSGTFMVGVLVQANHGDRHQLRVNGVPIGQQIGFEEIASPWEEPATSQVEGSHSSLVGVIATDVPLVPGQCRRLAGRGAIGMARTGASGYSGSGDIFLAFSTGNHHSADADAPLNLQMLPQHHLNPLFDAVAEGVEEAILNALVAADTMRGYGGRTAHALPHARLQALVGAQFPSSR